jgi:hypothetical protein
MCGPGAEISDCPMDEPGRGGGRPGGRPLQGAALRAFQAHGLRRVVPAASRANRPVQRQAGEMSRHPMVAGLRGVWLRVAGIGTRKREQVQD